jgi:hypothetical protein
MDADDEAWMQSMFEAVAGDQRVKDLAWQLAEHMLPEDERDQLSEADLQAARRYLRACMMRMTQTEVQAMDRRELAGLWARGAVGAREYRLRRR